MKFPQLASAVLVAGLSCGQAMAELAVRRQDAQPSRAIKPTGTWDAWALRAGDFVYVAGMRGIDPKTNTLVQGEEARIRQAFSTCS